MLGFEPLAAAPFGATGEAGNAYDASLDDSAQASTELAALAIFSAGLPLESVVGQDAVLVAASVFGTLVDESASAASTDSSLVVFGSTVDEAATETDAVAAQAIFQANYSEAVTATDSVLALATFQAAVSELLSGQDSFVGGLVFMAFVEDLAEAAMVAGSIGVLNANTTDAGTGLDAPAASVIFPAQLNDSSVGSVTALVAPSIFSAPINETASAFDSVLAGAVFVAIITDGAVAADEFVRRLLWEVINASQAVNWSDANTSQSTTWGTIDNSQSTAWTPVKTQT